MTTRLLKKLLSDKKRVFAFAVTAIILLFLISHALTSRLLAAYEELQSVEIKDRYGKTIAIYPNSRGHYMKASEEIPDRLKELVVKKEDKFFYYHPGINPGSLARAVARFVVEGNPGGSSTITQQVAKILLGNESERTLLNKTVETIYAFALEINLGKDEILEIYINSVYLGNQAQGFEEASLLYFGKSPKDLTDGEIVRLLATISNPSNTNPWNKGNDPAAEIVARRLDIDTPLSETPAKKKFQYQTPLSFEIGTLKLSCKGSCQTSFDLELSEKLREILRRNIALTYERGGRNGAIVVIKVPENELLAIVGSPDPGKTSEGAQINMALEPRPIGSTVKPLIYIKGFEEGLRPYTLVNDREYKYPIATGFPLYPKNYDGLYHGKVTLHYALSNSLNVPAVKVLEYIGLSKFYDFLENHLAFRPIQSLDSYQFGIALGGLEMDPLTLAHYFTIFPNEGTLQPLSIVTNSKITYTPPQNEIVEPRVVADKSFAELVTKILSDRKTSVDQFGIKNNLSLPFSNYAVKTGTSRDYHDSWVYGYTPDFVVGVWLGNIEYTPLKQVSGASGAGRIWRETMEFLFVSPYYSARQFDFSNLKEIPTEDGIEYGLLSDASETARNLLAEEHLIERPHDEDTFQFFPGTKILLDSAENVIWFANGEKIGEGRNAAFSPGHPGKFEIEALAEGGRREFIKIEIINP